MVVPGGKGFFFLLGDSDMWLWVSDDDDANEALSWMDNSETVEQEDGDLEGG